MSRLAPSLHRIGERYVNCYLVEEAGRVTIVDAGVPGQYGDLIDELDAMGRSIDADLRAAASRCAVNSFQNTRCPPAMNSRGPRPGSSRARRIWVRSRTSRKC